MFLRATNSWISHGPKDMEDLAFEFFKATSGTSFRRPRLRIKTFVDQNIIFIMH